jgi:hypothetical protein
MSRATHVYEKVPASSTVAPITGWVPEDACVAKKSFGKHDDTAVMIKTRLFGSATVKNH